MNSVKMFGVAALAALMTMAFVGVSSTMAESTVLCTADESSCEAANTITHVHETTLAGSPAILLNSVGNVTCDTLFLGGVAAESTSPLILKGNFTYSNCVMGSTGCTVTEVNGPSETKVLKEGHETAKVTGEGEVKVKCGSFINCTYNDEGLEATAKGPLLSPEANGSVSLSEQVRHKVSGFLCPEMAQLDITTTPLSATYIASGGALSGFISSDIYGLGNEDTALKQCFHGKEGFEEDPVNCATGNLTESQTDLAVGGRLPMELVRTYNSQLAATQKSAGAFGYGWTGPYSDHIEFNKEAKTATVVNADGSTAVFYEKEGKYTTNKWIMATLVVEGASYIFTEPNQIKEEFNSSGKLTKIIDRHANTLTLSYNGKGQLEAVTQPGPFASRRLIFTYNANGQVESVKGMMNQVVKYSYESGNLTAVFLPGQEKARWKFGYDESHQMTALTDGRGNTMKTTYDESNRVISQTDPMERKTTWEYKTLTAGFQTTLTEPNKAVTVEEFTGAGELTSITHASGTALAATTTYTYDESLNPITITDPNKHTTTYEYDGSGNRIREEDPNGNTTKWTYNSTHDVESITTPRGEKTEFILTAAGDPEWIVREGPGTTFQETHLEYDKYGDLIVSKDPLGRTTTYEYETAFYNSGSLMAEIDSEGDKRTWIYNFNSEVVGEVSPRGNEAGAESSKFKTSIQRDEQGRPTTITDPLGHTIKYAYDADGNVETLTDANGHTTTYTYDADNERTKVKAPNGNTTEAAYDNMGQVSSRTDGNAHTTKYERNLLEQVTEEVDPLERKTTKTYDVAGNLEKVKDAEGRTTTYTYDPANRLTKVSYSEEATPSVSLEYDKDGNVVVMKDGTGTTKKTYDQLGRLTEVENGNKEVVKYEYDLAEELTKLTYPNSKSITRAFDKAGRLEKITDWLKGETKFAYNRDSELKATTFPSATGNKDENEFNNADQLTKTTMLKGAETLASLSYTREKAGQLEVATQKGLPGEEKAEYGYDENNRLSKGAGSSFEYDAANNPTKVGSATFSYDKASELEKGGGVTYSFNKVGERTKATPEVGPATTYGYNQAGNLISVKRPEEGKVSKIEDAYAYDGTGLRASQTISGTTTHMAWDTATDLPLLLADGTNSYIYGPEGVSVGQINSKEEPLYLHHDQQGSIRLLTGSGGKAEGTYTYTPYGGVEGHTGTASTPMGFDGQYTSSDTGQIYLRARVYDPTTAQFLSIDPMVVSTGAPYSYAGDNPASLGDATGLEAESECDGEGDPTHSNAGSPIAPADATSVTHQTAPASRLPEALGKMFEGGFDGAKTELAASGSLAKAFEGGRTSAITEGFAQVADGLGHPKIGNAIRVPGKVSDALTWGQVIVRTMTEMFEARVMPFPVLIPREELNRHLQRPGVPMACTCNSHPMG